MQVISDFSFNHQLITLARESRGLSQTQLAGLLDFSQGKISKIENGMLSVTEEELVKIASTLEYPVNFFKRNARIYGVGLSEFYHRKKQSVPQKVLNKIYAKIELRRMEIMSLLKSVDIGEDNFVHMDPDQYDGNVEKIAQITRAHWRVPSGPINNIVNVIEEAGGIVIPFDFEGSKIDGISIWHPDLPPLIFVNYDRAMDRIRFTLAHEVGHLIMHRKPPMGDVDIEDQADRFASEFLMPTSDIKHSLSGVNLELLASLKLYWKVSMGALLMRAAQLGKISERQSRYLWMQMGKAGYRSQEPPELAPPIENPRLLDEIVEVHQNDLNYSLSDLSSAVGLKDTEFRSLYVRNNIPHLKIVR